MIRTYLALSLFACSAFAREPLTVVAQFDHPYSEEAVKVMQKELQTLMDQSGVDLNWRFFSELPPSVSFPDLVVVKFHGACAADVASHPWSGKAAALAYTHVSDGQVLPFSEVDCDEIRSFAATRFGSPAFTLRDRELGRALGRVMAHELNHILTRSRGHAREGVFQRALSSADLTARRFH